MLGIVRFRVAHFLWTFHVISAEQKLVELVVVGFSPTNRAGPPDRGKGLGQIICFVVHTFVGVQNSPTHILGRKDSSVPRRLFHKPHISVGVAHIVARKKVVVTVPQNPQTQGICGGVACRMQGIPASNVVQVILSVIFHPIVIIPFPERLILGGSLKRNHWLRHVRPAQPVQGLVAKLNTRRGIDVSGVCQFDIQNHVHVGILCRAGIPGHVRRDANRKIHFSVNNAVRGQSGIDTVVRVSISLKLAIHVHFRRSHSQHLFKRTVGFRCRIRGVQVFARVG